MGAEDGITTSSENYNRHDHYDSDNEVAGVDTKAFSGTLNERDGSKSVRFNFPDDAPGSSSTGAGGMKSNGNTETTLDVVDDTGAIHDHSVKTAGGADVEDPELTLLGKGLEKRSLSASLVRNASSRIRQVLTASTSKLPVSRTKSAAAPPALKGLKFINKKDVGKEWTECKKRFDDLTKETDGLLPRSLFWECIGMNRESKEFAGQLFDSLSRRRNIKGGRINKTQLEEFWDIIVDQSFDSSLRTFFEMVDKDANGRITKDEVRLIISLSASANKLSNIQNQADEYAALIMEELEPDNLGFIMIEELEFLLLQEPIYYVSVESKNLSRMSTQKPETTQHGNRVSRWYENFKFFLQDNWQRCWVLVLWIVAMVSLFTWKYVEYKQRVVYDLLGPCVCIAKGAAETLKLNMAIMLLPVCRNTITWLRNKTRLGVAVPFDDNIIFHQLIAMAIAIGVALHAISHLACDFPRLIHATEEEYAPLKQFFGDQAKSYWHFVKEVEGYTGITMVVLMTIAFTLATPWLRKRTLALPKKKIFANRLLEKWLRGAFGHFMKLMGFNAFWYSHHLFVIVYGMLIVHGIKLYLTKKWYKKTTWMYLAVPISLYACERLIRSFRSKLEPVNIRKAAVYQKNLVTLYMTKPQGFKYQSGQYMFVKCKAVSPFEWHPFSITSAPGDDYLSVHIKNNGDWTGKLIDIFTEACKTSSDEDSDIHIRYDHQLENSTFPKVVIDGPYGAPAQDYRKYDVVLLIGLGIGATPMISIVKDIVDDMRAKEDEENDLENGAGLQSGSNSYNKTRAYFYWMSREQGSYDWFDGVMNEIAEIDKNGIIEMHNHCTSVFEEGDVRSAIITTIQSLNYAKNGVDPVSGTRVKTHFAKPNWENVYRQMALNHPGSKIGVFYCGAPVAVKELKTLALKFSHETLTSTTFEFHKENF